MSKLLLVIVSLLFSVTAIAADLRESPHAKKSFEIYEKIISFPTVAGRDQVQVMTQYLVDQFNAAGFGPQDITVTPKGDSTALTVRYAGDGSSNKKPILLLAHMDVVEALADDWERPLFELTQDDTYFYGRGTVDNKLGVAMLSSTFIRLKKAGFVPNRDLIIVFTGDEESTMLTTRMLAESTPLLADAEFALNSDAGGGTLNKAGKAITYRVQAAEKTYATFELTIRNAGGHSSRPRSDNAIYELASALTKIQNHQFPVMSSKMTQNFFRITGQQLGGELGHAMNEFANDPSNQAAADRLATEPSYVGATRTTCIATMLSAGHAENALPQSATATINCRIFPGSKVDDIKTELVNVVENPSIKFVTLDDPIESPVSELREDVIKAISKAVHSRYPEVPIMAYMESGGTDGMHFRSNGIPTWAISSVFMNPDEMYAHGLNERLPIQAFYEGLDHWSVILKELASN